MSDDLRKLAEACLGPHDYTAQRLDAERAWQRATEPTAILALLDRVERLERAVAGVFADWQSSGDGDFVLWRLRAALEVDRE